MKTWQRVLAIIASFAGLYLLWRFPPVGLGAVLLGVCGAFLGRSMYRSGLAQNPIGENADFSVRPVVIAIAKCSGLFAAALVWSALGGYAVKHGYVPDNYFGATLVFGPALVLLAASVFYLFKAMARFNFGGQPPAG